MKAFMPDVAERRVDLSHVELQRRDEALATLSL
jgi:hypothetical protein